MPEQVKTGCYYERFSPRAHPWRCYLTGGGTLEQTETTLRLVITGSTDRHYSDAQIDDYRCIPNCPFPWNPPLRLIIRARFSHPAGGLRGTAGFGFWNYPFLMPEGRLPSLPRAIWFFYASPPSDMPLAYGTPGFGWKAATIDTLHPRAMMLIPLAPLVIPLMHIPPLYRLIWPPLQRMLRIREVLIPDTIAMDTWHVYTIEWGMRHARLAVDGQPVLEYAPSPSGPLCFVAWVDNQYLVVTPQGRFRWGLLAIPDRQFVDISWLAIEPTP